MIARSKKIIILPIIFFLTFLASSAHARLVYSKPEFRGRVIDADTKQPIEGAVVVVIYHRTAIFGFVDVIHGISDAMETLTDKNGEFFFPAYNNSNPLWREDFASFIFFKPGYKSSNGPLEVGNSSMIEKYFSISESEIGKVGEIKLYKFHTWLTWTGPLGIVKLKKGEDNPLIPTDYRSDKLPFLFKALNEDRKKRGYEGELK
jgi:hypothetical protein